MNEPKYVVLWMQGESFRTMRAVSKVVRAGEPDLMYEKGISPNGGVYYSKDYEDRRVMTAAEANECAALIRTLYGQSQDLAIVQDAPRFADREARDEFLPVWAWRLNQHHAQGVLESRIASLQP